MIFTQKQIGIRNLQGCRLKKLHQGATSPDSTPKDAYNIVVQMINVQMSVGSRKYLWRFCWVRIQHRASSLELFFIHPLNRGRKTVLGNLPSQVL